MSQLDELLESIQNYDEKMMKSTTLLYNYRIKITDMFSIHKNIFDRMEDKTPTDYKYFIKILKDLRNPDNKFVDLETVKEILSIFIEETSMFNNVKALYNNRTKSKVLTRKCHSKACNLSQINNAGKFMSNITFKERKSEIIELVSQLNKIDIFKNYNFIFLDLNDLESKFTDVNEAMNIFNNIVAKQRNRNSSKKATIQKINSNLAERLRKLKS